jgi:hypothetical protein
MLKLLRLMGLLAGAFLASGTINAATPKEIDAAIKRGADWLKANNRGQGVVSDTAYGVGPGCLAGLAMLEAGVPPSDPALKALTDQIRNAAYTQTRTYQVSLCLMFLDRLGEPSDVPLIQILAVRLLVGQTNRGGWTYDCVQGQQVDEQTLRAIKPINQQGPPKLHPDVEKYAQFLAAAKARGNNVVASDDNSNTQFGTIAVWMSRKHGVPVDDALRAIDARFMSTQTASGKWPYSGLGVAPVAGPMVAETSSPAMYCAGLIGLSTGVALREERRNKEAPKKEEPKKDPGNGGNTTPDDPFFNPPQPKSKPEPKKPAPPKTLDERDQRVKLAFAGLGTVLAESAKAGQGGLFLKTGQHGFHDLYFYWSLERACVIYGVDKVGGVDWYDLGANTLVANQSANGSWGDVGGGTGYNHVVHTSFAVLFLCRSNLARDLSGKVQNSTETTMRAGGGPGAGTGDPKPGNGSTGADPNSLPPAPFIPGATGNEASALAFELVRSTDKDWSTLIRKLRDTRGGNYTEALVTAANRLEGDRLKQARDALAERLTRMTADTLRAMAKSEEAELRRGAYLAMAMKDDKAHIPDLIAAILDDEEFVVRAAKAGLKSLTNQDFGPNKNANIGEKKLAKDAWQSWWDKQKK